jgi:hypothetical protein
MNKNLNKENNFKTPILFLIFNRPKLTKQVFAEIKKIKPKQLYIAADGPRKNKLNDKEKCKESRKIINDINWSCEIKTFFREENLGCEKAVSSAITWFFKNVEQGIILEDDVLPDQSFFFFCQKLLSKYKNNILNDLRDKPKETYKEILKFLEVDNIDFIPKFKIKNPNLKPRKNYLNILLKSPNNSLKKYIYQKIVTKSTRKKIYFFLDRKNKIIKSRSPINKELELKLKKEFKPEVEKLSEITDRDLIKLWGYK